MVTTNILRILLLYLMTVVWQSIIPLDLLKQITNPVLMLDTQGNLRWRIKSNLMAAPLALIASEVVIFGLFF